MHTYESTTKKLANHSSTASDQLYRTRTTLASAVGVSVFTFLGAALPLFFPRYNASGGGLLGDVANCVVSMALLVSSRRYVAGFWEGKMSVPAVGEYNEAVGKVRVWGGIVRWSVIVVGVRLVIGGFRELVG